MYDESEYDHILKALSHTSRRAILDSIKDDPKTTSQLCSLLSNLDRCTVMQHLNVLEKADLIIIKHKGKHRWNYINLLPIKEIHDRWIRKYSVEALDVLSRMKKDLE
ncbi:MAG TPA: helix-turn-helix transcriptional regulator [Candidatus Nitrosocosmicus sp.]|jgi:DNA-binding transcriptional ArsR family regulator|nr:helix-turn-helix transcriptional regulator [Candidatus Nitrosocosmicus sp.]